MSGTASRARRISPRPASCAHGARATNAAEEPTFEVPFPRESRAGRLSDNLAARIESADDFTSFAELGSAAFRFQ